MKLSNRIQAITGTGSDGWDVFYRARRMIAAGDKITELTIGEHDIKTDVSIMDAMDRSARAGNTGYAAVPGSLSLREAVANRVQTRTGVKTNPDNVLITTGGQAALFSAHLALLDQGDVGLYTDPYYATYPGSIRALGAKAVAVPTHSRNNFLPQREDLNARIEGSKSLLINSPNNPTGVVYPRETLEMVSDFCLTNNVALISDEVYDTQVWSGQHHTPRALPGMIDQTLVIGSMSKSHAMTGFRVGWIIGPEEAISTILDLSTVNAYGVPGFVQDAAEFALGAGDDLEHQVSDVFRNRLKLAQEVLAGSNAIRMIPAGGAMYVMLDIRATDLTGEEFANKLLDSEQIAVMPGESFGQSAAGHIRVAMTIPDDKFSAALKRVVSFTEELVAARA